MGSPYRQTSGLHHEENNEGPVRVSSQEERCARSVSEEEALIGDVLRSRRVNRKIDLALLPFLSTLYLFNGLDRSNIGNAETQGRHSMASMEG